GVELPVDHVEEDQVLGVLPVRRDVPGDGDRLLPLDRVVRLDDEVDGQVGGPLVQPRVARVRLGVRQGTVEDHVRLRDLGGEGRAGRVAQRPGGGGGGGQEQQPGDGDRYEAAKGHWWGP